MNVQAIKILIKTNIPGQEDILFTKALLYHPDFTGLSNEPGYNEYPYISDNKVIPQSLINELARSKNYKDITDFFFNKNVFLSRFEAHDKEINTYEEEENQDDQINENLNKNIKNMLLLLFPTEIPFSKNVKDSYSLNIDDTSEGSGLKVLFDPIMELFNYFKFSFVAVNGKEYTVNRVVWLNDVMNHPGYSKLFEEFINFKAWSIDTLNSLLTQRRKNFIKMIDTCVDELTENEKTCDNKSDDSGVYGMTYKIIQTITTELNDTYKKYLTKNQLDEFKTNISRLHDLAKIIHCKSNQPHNQPHNEIVIFYNDLKNKKISKETTIETLKKEHNQIQIQIDKLKIDDMNDIVDKIYKLRGVLSDKIRTFISNLYEFYKDNVKIQSIINKIIDNKYDERQVPSEYSYISKIYKLMNDYASDNRTSSNNTIQLLIDNYVNRQEKSTQNIEKFIQDINEFKKKHNISNDINQFKLDYVTLNKKEDKKSPSYEIYIQLDVIGGILDASNVKKARCMYKDKKLTKEFYNIRQKLINAKWQVKTGVFFNVSDIGSNEKPNKIPPNRDKKTVKNPQIQQGGAKTRKKRKIRRR